MDWALILLLSLAAQAAAIGVIWSMARKSEKAKAGAVKLYAHPLDGGGFICELPGDWDAGLTHEDRARKLYEITFAAHGQGRAN